MANSLRSYGMAWLAGILVLSLGTIDAYAQSITAEGSTKVELKNEAPGISWKHEELYEINVVYNNQEQAVQSARVIEIDDPFRSYFFIEDCQFEAHTITFMGAFEHTEPGPHRIEYAFDVYGEIVLSTADPSEETDFSVPDAWGSITVVKVLGPGAEPAPPPRDFAHIHFPPDADTEAPIFLCDLWVEITVAVDD